MTYFERNTQPGPDYAPAINKVYCQICLVAFFISLLIDMLTASLLQLPDQPNSEANLQWVPLLSSSPFQNTCLHTHLLFSVSYIRGVLFALCCSSYFLLFSTPLISQPPLCIWSFFFFPLAWRHTQSILQLPEGVASFISLLLCTIKHLKKKIHYNHIFLLHPNHLVVPFPLVFEKLPFQIATKTSWNTMAFTRFSFSSNVHNNKTYN